LPGETHWELGEPGRSRKDEMLLDGKMSDVAEEGPMTKDRHSGRRMRNRKNIF